MQGNHDPLPPEGFGGRFEAEYDAGPLVFRHQAIARRRGRNLRAPPSEGRHPARGCVGHPALLRLRSRRLMMPAFGAYAGGLDVRDPPIARLFPRGGRVFLLGRERLFSFSLTAA